MTADEARARMLAALDRCAATPRLPEPARLRVETLRAAVTSGRALRVAVAGRRGSGKSSLVNAVAGAPVARVGDVADTTMRPWPVRAAGAWWLDTPGLRAGGRGGRRGDVIGALRAFAPDALVVAVSATEVDAGIDDDLDDVREMLRALESEGAPARLLAAVTRVDELDPADVSEAPFDDDEKRAHIAGATSTLHRHALRHGLAPARVIPLCALAEWERASLVYDRRWNLAALDRALREAPRPRSRAAVAKDLARSVRSLGGALVEHAAAEAAHVARTAPGARRAEVLGVAHGSLVDALDALFGALTPTRAAGLRESLGALSRGRGIAEALRAGLDGIGATRASAAVASGRVRALGRAVLALEGYEVDEGLVDAALGTERGLRYGAAS